MDLVEGQIIMAQMDTLRERLARFVGARGCVGFSDVESDFVISELRASGTWTEAVDTTLAGMIKNGKPRGEAVAVLTAGNAQIAGILDKMKKLPVAPVAPTPIVTPTLVPPVHIQPKK